MLVRRIRLIIQDVSYRDRVESYHLVYASMDSEGAVAPGRVLIATAGDIRSLKLLGERVGVKRWEEDTDCVEKFYGDLPLPV